MVVRIILVVWLAALSGVGVYVYVVYQEERDARFATQQEVLLLRNELVTTNALLATTSALSVDDRVRTADQLYRLEQRLATVEDEIGGFNRKVGRITGSVEELERLQNTDPQLLQKYSRVYFLNEHYIPGDLTVIDEAYDHIDGKQVSVHAQMWPFLKKLLKEAQGDGVTIKVLSGYRSFVEQSSLKEAYSVRYGAGANTFSADQGYSEHQLGTTVDFIADTPGATLAGFDQTDAYRWLTENAYRYGFVLSYPQNNEYYIFEPWHWRFVGTELAKDLRDDNKHLYDLEQRELDKYLADLFE